MSKFRTTELSDPRFEADNLRFITVKSSNLRGRGDICVFVPEGEFADLPVAILLHGVYGSAWVWSQKGGAHRVANELIKDKRIMPMVLVMPSDGLWGDGSAYLEHNNFNFELWIIEDVRNAVIELIPEVSQESKFCIGGLSMGGYGALYLGAKYGERFTAISVHSSITSLAQLKLFVEEGLNNYYQGNPIGEDISTTILANRSKLPPLRLDCGKDDELIEYNRLLHEKLVEHKVEHEYQEHEGGHSWEYWRKYLPETLRFFNRMLTQSLR